MVACGDHVYAMGGFYDFDGRKVGKKKKLPEEKAQFSTKGVRDIDII